MGDGENKNSEGQEKTKKSLTFLAEVENLTNIKNGFEYEKKRARISDEYGVRKSIIDQSVKEIRRELADITSEESVVIEAEPWNEPVNGRVLLDTMSSEIKRYVVLPEGASDAIAVWALMTYCHEAFRVLPILGIVSPEKRCGKTTLLEALLGFCNKALPASNISSAAVYRAIEKFGPSLLVDEADTFLKSNEELRGVLNSGHTRSMSYTLRCEGDNNEPKKFSTWGPKAIACIGNLPGTLEDRSILICLKRKAPGESCQKLDVDFQQKNDELRQRCRRWCDDHLEALKITKVIVDAHGNDRAADNWTPLHIIGEVAGHGWRERIEKSMRLLLNLSDADQANIGTMLLSDIRDVFLSEKMFSAELVDKLNSFEERPWAEWSRGKGLSANWLARLLRPYGIESKQLRKGGETKKGYKLSIFQDAFFRYLPPRTPVSSETQKQSNGINKIGIEPNETQESDVSFQKQHDQLDLFECFGVSLQKRGNGGECIKKNEKEMSQEKLARLRLTKEEYEELVSN